jgi:hydroxymethylglutaryl-CoA synthase
VTDPVAIIGVGAAAPAWRIDAKEIGAAWDRGGHGQIAACAPDEDTLTLAAEAAGRALGSAGLGGGDVDGLWWGTTRPPFAEGPSHAVLAAACGLDRHADGALLAGSSHSGIEALLAAADAVAAQRVSRALVVVSDATRPGLGTGLEARTGAGAAAVVITRGAGPAHLDARVTLSRPFLDRYRGDLEHDTRDLYDPRLFREEIFLPELRSVVESISAHEPTAWSLPDPDGRLGAVIAKPVTNGEPAASAAVYTELGETGAAAALLGGLGSLATTGVVAIVAYGGGRTTAVTIAVDSPVPGATEVAGDITGATKASYGALLRSRNQLVATGETIQMGIPPESAGFVRGADEMLELLGARCLDCGTINTPPSIHPHCIACGATKFELVQLARRGVVHTYVINHTMPAPFVAPLPIAVIDLEDGARIMLQCIGNGTGLEIGSTVELKLRRYAYERGVPVYGYKAHLIQEA